MPHPDASCDVAVYWRLDAFPRYEEAPVRAWCLAHGHCYDSGVGDAPWCYYSWESLRRFALQAAFTALAALVVGFLALRYSQHSGAGAPRKATLQHRERLTRQLARELGEWPASPDGHGVLPEYRAALSATCLAPHVLRASPVRERLAALASWRRSLLAHEELPTGRALLDALARRSGAVAVGVVDSAFNFFCQAADLDAESLTVALQCALCHGSADACSSVLFALQDGAGFCRSRARFVMQGVVNACAATLPAVAGTADSPAEDVAAALSSASVGSSAVARARSLLGTLCNETAQDLKDAAFRQVFIEPALWYAALVRNSTLAGDVEVHGGGVHAALLEAAIGVRTSRLPELADGVIGVVDYLRAADATGGAFAAGAAALVSAEHLGRAAARVRVCSAVQPGASAAVPADAFVFSSRREECSVRELADRAAGAGSTAERRAHYARYLEAFTHLLSAEVVLPRLVAAVLGSSSRGAVYGEDGLRPELQAVYEALRDNGGVAKSSEGAEGDAEGVTDVRHWLYDTDTGALRKGAALRLFAAIGVVVERSPLLSSPAEPLPYVLPPSIPSWRLAGGWGGPGGIFFDDAAALGGAANVRRILQVVVRAGAAVDAIQATYELADGDIVAAPGRGGSGGTAYAVDIAPGETIVGVTGHAGAYIHSLAFLIAPSVAGGHAPATRVAGPFGSRPPRARPFSLDGPVIAFAGRAGLLLDHLQVFVAAGPAGPAA